MDENFSIPKYGLVKKYIIHLLKDDVIAFDSLLPSEHELMTKFNVSRHTVRQAFGELASEGFVCKRQGKGTFSRYKKPAKDKQIVAVVTTYISDYVFPDIIAGIEQVLSDEGYMMLLSNTNNIKKREAQYLNSVLEHNVVGMIIEPTRSAYPNENLELLQDIRNKGIKSVFINAFYDDFDSSYVLLDDFKGGFLATQYLLQLGHTKIAGLFKTDDIQGVNRKCGYVEALKAAGSAVVPGFIGEFETDRMFDFPYTFMNSLLQSENRPTAIVCYNDQLALMVVQAIHDRGLRIPQDISIVGYDDSLSAVNSEIRLTTIRHPRKEMGVQAAKLVIDMLEGNQEKIQIVYQPELIVRSSCRKL